jgi:hypothetical protein
MKARRSRRLQQRIDQAIERSRRAGGLIAYPDDTPDEILEAFLDEIEGCPLCREMEERGSSDPALREH